ncbi:hypothetical protein N7510_001218 [Penicillium lagena]|uniref:uncharacterized protein n=1 Tax=Penicillium lagena TaxID=94218 RepID=UPI0025407F2C|nr:uncharacterized protein N7510_001218 [Penicillium lagena]KAJ5624909.1 hypothetical protein N7510_001218 [Penicillium lagena]
MITVEGATRVAAFFVMDGRPSYHPFILKGSTGLADIQSLAIPTTLPGGVGTTPSCVQKVRLDESELVDRVNTGLTKRSNQLTQTDWGDDSTDHGSFSNLVNEALKEDAEFED